MQYHEYDDFFTTLQQLFTRVDMNDTQKNLWGSVLSRLSLHDAITAVNDCYRESTVGTLHLSTFRAKVNKTFIPTDDTAAIYAKKAEDCRAEGDDMDKLLAGQSKADVLLLVRDAGRMWPDVYGGLVLALDGVNTWLPVKEKHDPSKAFKDCTVVEGLLRQAAWAAVSGIGPVIEKNPKVHPPNSR